MDFCVRSLLLGCICFTLIHQTYGTHNSTGAHCPSDKSAYDTHTVHWSFETTNKLVCMEGGTQATCPALVSGQIGSAVSTTLAQSQWIDLGTHPELCITQGNCESGAFSMWLKVVECTTVDGIMSTYSYSRSRGFYLFCYSGNIGYFFHSHDANYFASATIPSGWTHLVLNYIGSGSGEGIRVIYNGGQVASDTTSWGYIRHAPNGRIVIGRVYTDHSIYYSSVQVDQLAFFNRALSNDEMTAMYNLG